jgi:hypothetical protein
MHFVCNVFILDVAMLHVVVLNIVLLYVLLEVILMHAILLNVVTPKNNYDQGTLTEGNGSVQLTSSIKYKYCSHYQKKMI